MLSRAALKAGAFGHLLRPGSQSTHAIAVRCSSVDAKTHLQNWDAANKVYFGPERDTKNFPLPSQPKEIPPTRLGFLPESWFTAFYEKTGVTGPYMLLVSAGAYAFHSELIPVEHTFIELLSFSIAAGIVVKKLGPGISKFLTAQQEEYEEKCWNEPIRKTKASSEATIKAGNEAIWQMEGQKYLFQAKRENVDLQLEAAYRQRLADVHSEVKKRLDYQVALVTAKKQFEQKHMVNWITGNVVKAITPQQEKESITKCIQDLKALAAKRQAATV